MNDRFICHGARCVSRTSDKEGKALPVFRSIQFLAPALVGVAVLSIWASPAIAHPHVWVTAASELIYGPNGSVTAIRHAWIFDDMFSTYALQGIVTKKKGVYTREELAPLAQTNVDSLKEYGFFTYAKVDGKKQPFLPPTDYFLEYKDAALVLHFTLPFNRGDIRPELFRGLCAAEAKSDSPCRGAGCLHDGDRTSERWICRCPKIG